MENTVTSPGASPVPFQKFRGNYLHSLDAKKRVVVPAKWRDEAKGEFYAVIGSDGDHLVVMNEPEYDRVIDNFKKGRDETDPEVKEFISQMNSVTRTMTFDSQGRMTIASEHFQELKLKNEVQLIGHDTRFTIWNPATWQEKNGTSDAKQKMRDNMASVGL